MKTFPPSFPAPNISLSGALRPNSVRTAMDSGSTRQRRCFSTEATFYSVSWTMTELESGVFAAFHRYELDLGNDWFIMDLPTGGGDGMQPHVVRLVNGAYTSDYVPVGYWQLRGELEVRERVMFSADTLAFYLAVGFSGPEIAALFTDVSNFHTFLTVTYPTL